MALSHIRPQSNQFYAPEQAFSWRTSTRSRRLAAAPSRPSRVSGLIRLPRGTHASTALTIWTIAVALTLYMCPAEGQELWQRAQAGMTPLQIETLFSAAKTGDHSHLHSGASNDLTIAEYPFGDDRFTVNFFFLAGRLEEVILLLNQVKSYDSERNQSVFDRLVAQTTQEQGRPNGCQLARNITLFRGCEWLTKDIRIDIVYLDVGGQGIVLSAYFQPRLRKT